MLTLLRLGLMVLAIVPVFIGFGMPFFVPGWHGFALAFGLIFGGTWLLWIVHRRSRRWLDADTAFNRLLKTDGEFIVRNPTDGEPDSPRHDPSRRI